MFATVRQTRQQATRRSSCGIPPSVRKRRHAPQEVSGFVALSTRVPAALKRRLLVHCAERGIAVQRFVEEVVRERLVAEKKRQ